MTTTMDQHRTGTDNPPEAGIVDCDLHNTLDSVKDLYPYLSAQWREHIDEFGVRRYAGGGFPRFLPPREDARPPSGRASGSEAPFMATDHLDRHGIGYGILNVATSVGGQPNLALDAALASAANEWQANDWIDVDARYRASMVIPFGDPVAAVREIKRWEGNTGFVQVLFTGRPAEPMGRSRYWPIYEAAAAQGLQVMTHAFSSAGNPITGAGWPSYYLEDHVGPAQAVQANIVSMIAEGVFAEFPTLKFVSVENGFGWAPPLGWRMDNAWKLLGKEIWRVDNPPSTYLAENVYMATQPVEEPEKRGHLQDLFEEAPWMESRLLFSSDYPHWDSDSPEEAFPPSFDADLKHRIYCDNGRELYNLP